MHKINLGSLGSDLESISFWKAHLDTFKKLKKWRHSAAEPMPSNQMKKSWFGPINCQLLRQKYALIGHNALGKSWGRSVYSSDQIKRVRSHIPWIRLRTSKVAVTG